MALDLPTTDLKTEEVTAAVFQGGDSSVVCLGSSSIGTTYSLLEGGKAMRKALMCSVVVMVLTALLLGGTSEVFAVDKQQVRDLIRESDLPRDIKRQALDESRASEFAIVRGPDVGLNCGGSFSGIAGLIDIGPNLLALCVMRGAPFSSYEVFWTCTTVPGGCHDQACGFVTLGFLNTDASGRGVFWTLLAGNPYPGNYMHWDIIGPDVFTSQFFGIPARGGQVDGARGTGDPTAR
jgi:hypothetical protein